MNVKFLVIGSSIVSASAGAAAGYFLSKKQIEARLIEEYDVRLEEEVERTKRHLSLMYKTDDNSDPTKILARRTPQRPEGIAADDNATWANSSDKPLDEEGVVTVTKIIKGLRYGPPNVVVEPAKPGLNKPNNVFSHIPPDDPEDDNLPYVLTVEEFNQGLMGHDTTTLTLYSDGVLVDEDENPLDDVNKTIGLNNLKKFGQDPTGDDTTLHVRNKRSTIDFEIIKSEMTYADVVGLNEPDHVSAPKKANRRR